MTRSETRTRLLMVMVLFAPLTGCRTLWTPEQIIEYGTPSEFLTCSQAGAGARVDTVIGPRGGTLRAGGSELTIPEGALTAERRFVLQEETGQRVGVTIDDPRTAARLLKPATLKIDVSRCTESERENPRDWSVWRMGERDRSQKLRTQLSSRHATTVIDSTSVFMIAN